MCEFYKFDDDKTEILIGDMMSVSNRYVTVCAMDENGTQIEMKRYADELVDK